MQKSQKYVSTRRNAQNKFPRNFIHKYFSDPGKKILGKNYQNIYIKAFQKKKKHPDFPHTKTLKHKKKIAKKNR